MVDGNISRESSRNYSRKHWRNVREAVDVADFLWYSRLLMDLLLAVWREVCRHIEIDEAISRIAQPVADHVPADLILVRRLDLSRSVLDTVAEGACGTTARDALPRRTTIAPRDLPELLAWCRSSAVTRGPEGSLDVVTQTVVPPGISGEYLAGPLSDESGPIGALVIQASGGQWRPEHERVVASLLEPIAVALTNDARLHELARLREALEADKRALLSRLDRQDVAEAIIGAEGGLRDVMQRVEQVAATDTPVLLIGETGSGKEVVARTLHTQSRRASAPIVRVNCGAIPPGLVDSELFGHERGSFTGAVGTRHGWFERADGGTLFLDEIGELPLEAQVRLLRVLQDGIFERVGGHKPISVDVRIVAATHRDLVEMVAESSFREDLWYRISVFPIRLPPLRERPQDIPMLAAHFARRAGIRLGGSPLALAPHDIDLLLAYDWPGNVRELATVIERAAILGNGHHLHVGVALGVGDDASTHAPQPLHPTPARSSRSLERNDEAGRDIESALVACRGRIEGPFGAAARLGINPHTLRARMRHLGIEWQLFRDSARISPTSTHHLPLSHAGKRENERPIIEQALRAAYGRIEGPLGAAARLGMNPSTLRSRMRKLKIEWTVYRLTARAHK
ncbi:MAG: sigma 54-interacting transcriptional regulator [Vicinamibacteraceae bacterium]